MDFVVGMDIVLTHVSGSVGMTLCEVDYFATIWLNICSWLNCFCACDSLLFWLNCVCLWLFVCCLGCICGIGWIGWQFGKLWEVRDILWYCVSCWMFLELRVLSGFLGCFCCCLNLWDWLESWYSLKCWYSLYWLYCWVFLDCWACLVFYDSFMPVWKLVQFIVIFELFWTIGERCCGCTIFRTTRYFRTNYMI